MLYTGLVVSCDFSKVKELAEEVVHACVEHVVCFRVDAQLLQMRAFESLHFDFNRVAHYIHASHVDAVEVQSPVTDLLGLCINKNVQNLARQLLQH